VAEKETKEERLDRELEELLQELRLALPGVQILFGFLLVVPFNNRFAQTDDLERDVWFAALLLALGAVACFIAPTAYHRIQFREGDKEHMLMVSNRLAIVGSFFLAAAMCLVVFVITDVLFEVFWGPLLAAIFVGVFGWLWFGMPLLRRARS
jgi:hypothetical protein